MIDTVSGGAVSHVGVALTFGLIVLAMIYTIGDISGAHINPAVTIGFLVRRFEVGCVGRLPIREISPEVRVRLRQRSALSQNRNSKRFDRRK